MKNSLFALAVLVFLSACQKEVSSENPDGTPGTGPVPPPATTAGLLTRMVSVAGGDSVMVDYGYDANKRLATFDYKTTGTEFRFRRIFRNSAGIMTQFNSKGDDLSGIGIDSVITILSYNAGQARYTHGITIYAVSGVSLRDSTVYVYDNAGNLTVKRSYATVLPAPYQEYQKTEYTYASGNVTSEKYYTSNSAGGWDLEYTYNYGYDSKVNPAKFGPEGMIVLEDASYFSNNNKSGVNYIDGADASYNFSQAYTYTYNAANKPTGGTVVETPGSGSYTIRYYYN